MTAHHLRLPVAVAPELAPERRQVRTHEVGRADRRVDQNPAAGAADPVVHLVVLVAHHRFVELSDPVEQPPGKGAEVDRVDLLDLAGIAEAGRADAEAAVHRRGDALTEQRSPLGRHRPTHILGAGGEQPLDAAPHVVGRHDRVGVDAQEDVAARGAETQIQRRWHQSTGILEPAEPGIATDGALDDLARAVVRAAVDDEDLEPLRRIVLCPHGAEAFGDRPRLVAHGNDDGHERRLRTRARLPRRGRHAGSDPEWPEADRESSR